MTLACGLDFGTSNSTMGFVGADGVPRLLPLEGGRQTMPSVLFFSFEDRSTHFGRGAIAEYVAGAEGRLLRSLKSVLGTALFDDGIRVGARLPLRLTFWAFSLPSSRRAETEAGAPLDAVVVGRPVHFVDDDAAADAEAQRQLEMAGAAAGFYACRIPVRADCCGAGL
ncbi:hypothetical protein N8D56_21795 [Devosia sp. A8/3-2]|nr:hypothetical protein N8D56_21795 [Devosia sp. A8/3-2]